MQLFEGKLCSARELGRNRCGSRRRLLALTYRLCPHSSHGAQSVWRPRSPAKSQRLIRIRPHAKSGAAERVNRCAPFPPHFLRVAASSNPAFERTATGKPASAAQGQRWASANGTPASVVVFEGKRAIGVEVHRDGATKVVRARREVMLAAGAINSPQLLQLFGIGNSALLGHFGIPVVLESPGIGENLVDQYAVRMAARVRGMRTLNERAHGGSRSLKVRLRTARHVERLRVFDASAMPTMVSGITYAATIMIAEKSVDDLLRSRRNTIFCERKPISR